MTIDIRQEITCSAGPLISATIADDYISQSGLITTRGEVQIAGGTSATIGSGLTLTGVNRTLRVIGKSYSPLDNITYLQVSCPLGQALQAQDVNFTRRVRPQPEEPTWRAGTDDFSTISLTQILQQACLGMGLGYGITAPVGADFVYVSPGQAGVYEFNGPYASTLASILAAYGHYGYFSSGAVSSTSMLAPAGLGTFLLDESNIISTGPLGAGPAPAGSIVASISYNGLQVTRRENGSGQECVSQTASSETRYVRYTFNPDVADPEAELEEYEVSYQYAPTSRSCTTTDELGRVILVEETATATGALDNYAAVVGTAGFHSAATAAANRSVTQTTRTTREYDEAGHLVRELLEIRQERAALASALNLPFARPAELTPDGQDVRPAQLIYTLPAGTFVSERIERTVQPVGRDLQVVVRRWLAAGYTPEGQQAAAEAVAETRSGGWVSVVVGQAARLVQLPTETQTLEGRAAQWNAELREAEDATNFSSATEPRYAVAPTNDSVVLNGTPGAGVVSLSVPFSPDTSLVVATTEINADGSSTTRYEPAPPAAAQNLARAFATDYQRLATAMRFGFSVQVGLDRAPSAVTQHYQVRIRGTAGLYLSTGATFQLTAEGGICSMDLLSLGGIASSGEDQWLPAVGPLPPLPPTITDPTTGDTVYDLTDVVLTPVLNPLTPATVTGIRLGVAAASIAGPASTTETVLAGVALGMQASSIEGSPVTSETAESGITLGVLVEIT